MVRTNRTVSLPPKFTHEGGPARHIPELQELRRLTLSALLFEDTFYEAGSLQAQQVSALVAKADPDDIVELAVECRERMYLRHMPLFLIRELARRSKMGKHVAYALSRVIQRPDELTEYLAIYWKDRRQPVSAGSKRGLAAAFLKFDADTLAKYDRDHAVKLRDVLRITHAKPESAEQSAVWKKLIAGELESPDTWEVALSSGADKRETFERLLREKKLGGLAFLRNLRGMIEAKVDHDLMRERFNGGFGKVLPFRFVAALRYAPQFIRDLDAAMQRCMTDLPRLPGKTGILVDVSGSMDDPLSARSEMKRVDVAAGLAVLISGIAEFPRVWTFSDHVVEVPPFAGLALVDTIRGSQAHRGTYLGKAVTELANQGLDRLIVITDEQTHDRVPNPVEKGYLINVGTAKNGVGYGPWVHIDGWSERVIDFIQEYER